MSRRRRYWGRPHPTIWPRVIWTTGSAAIVLGTIWEYRHG
jgi:hypothetical protein